MLIEVADLPELLKIANEAMQNLQAAREAVAEAADLKLFAAPPDPINVAV